MGISRTVRLSSSNGPVVPTGTFFFFQVVDNVSPFKKFCLPHKATDPLLSLSFRLWIFERRMIKLEMFQQSCDLNCRDSRILEGNTRVLSSRRLLMSTASCSLLSPSWNWSLKSSKDWTWSPKRGFTCQYPAEEGPSTLSTSLLARGCNWRDSQRNSVDISSSPSFTMAWSVLSSHHLLFLFGRNPGSKLLSLNSVIPSGCRFCAKSLCRFIS